ncbi:hypothetical protein [Fibrobacter sp.]|uniref:hypothetical protein n=1 Tax=Fibrobacter sp. TaxID=35828 RepID=UPI0025BBE262|nr:hypothetical protein [Fibrobacter sp.]
MDTTFVVNEQGQTVGIIHEKGTIPVMPQQQAAQPAQPVAAQPAQQEQLAAPQAVRQDQQVEEPTQQANAFFGPDSTMYYQTLIDRYTRSGNKLRRAGKGMMIGGGIGAGVGLLLLASASATDCDRYDNECKDDMEGMSDAGALLLLGGGAVFGTGIVIKIVGGSKLRKANRYTDMLTKHQMRRQYSMKLRFDPLINPIKKSVGGNLAMEF